MRVFASHSFFRLIFSFILYSVLQAQVNWNVYTEGGVFISPNPNKSSSRDLLMRIDGNMNYLYSYGDAAASLKLKVRPELFGSNDNFRSLKFKAVGNYYKKEEGINWGINLIGQKNFYYSNTTYFDYSIFMIAASSDWFENKDNPISVNLGYAYQTVSENLEQNLDLVFLDAKIFEPLFANNISGGGIYIERFTLENKYLKRNSNSVYINKGWRYGPQISFDYLKNVILSLEYRFLFHSSLITEHPSFEHWVRVVAGKTLSERWSIFLLADYSNRHFSIKKQTFFEPFLIYNPIDNENRVNLKLACAINDHFEVYLKSGYFKENFFSTYFNFEGWNLLLGFELNSK